jgi:hypothetical protein
MADNFELGFVIDTTPLARTKVAADQAADALGKTGAAADAAGRKIGQTAQPIKQTGDAAAAAAQKINGGAGSLGDSLGRIQGTLQISQQQLVALAGALGSGGGGAGLIGALGAAQGAFGRLAAVLGPVGSAVAGSAAAVAGLGVAYYGLSKPLAEAQDRLALLDARMRNALGSQVAATQTMDALYKATQKTGLGFRETADSFLRVARNSETLGATREEIQQLSDTVAKLGAVSGASRGEIGSGMLQLSQALASGKLNGDELRSIMENMPALAKAIAEGLGVSVGQLRAMGAAGELSSRSVFEAILKASKKANEEFARLPDTVERANQRSADAYDRFLAVLGQKWNSSGFVRGVSDVFGRIVTSATNALEGPGTSQQLSDARQRLLTGGRRLRPIGEDGSVTQESDEDFLARRIRQLGAQNALVREYLTLLERQNAEEEEAARARIVEAERKARAPIVQAQELGANEFDDFNKKLNATRQNVERVEAGLKLLRERIADGTATDDDRGLLPSLIRQAGIGRAELEGMRTELGKLEDETRKRQSFFNRAGTASGADFLSEADRIYQATRRQDPSATMDGAMGTLGRQRAQDLREETAALRIQTEQTNLLTQAQGRGVRAVREAELAQRLFNDELRFLGGPEDPRRNVVDLVNAWLAYKAAVEGSVKAEWQLNDAQRGADYASRLRVLERQIELVGKAYEQRRAQAEEEARRSGSGALRVFDAEEELKAREDLYRIEQRIATLRAQAQPGITAQDRRNLDLEAKITEAQANVAPELQDALGTAMRNEAEAERSKMFQEQEDALQNQLRLLQQRARLTNFSTEEARVQIALLEKRNELEAQNAPPEVIARQLAITEQIQRQTLEYERQTARINGVMNVLESGIMSFGNIFTKTFEDVFTTGKFKANEFLAAMGQGITRLGAQMVYEIGVKPFVMALANMAKTFGMQVLGSMGAGGAPNMQATNAQLNAGVTDSSGTLLPYAKGGAFASGNVIPFATGGIVTRPTLFPMANGRGLMGEAGPEAILPLKRGPDGALGLSGGGGGGTVVVINDMRTNKDSKAAETEESMGPDGRKMISVLIRDEVKKGMNSGDYDRTLQTSYNLSRQVQRR